MFGYSCAIAGKPDKHSGVKGQQKYNQLDQAKQDKGHGDIVAKDADYGHGTGLSAVMSPGMSGNRDAITCITASHPFIFHVFIIYYLIIFFRYLIDDTRHLKSSQYFVTFQAAMSAP